MMFHRIVLFALLAAAAAGARAETFYYPNAESPVFSVDIPNDWKPKENMQGRIEAGSPEDDAYVALWVLKGKSAMDELGEEVREITESTLRDIRLSGKETRTEVNGMDVLFFEGAGVDKEDGDKVHFEICLFTPAPGTLGVVYFEYDDDAAEKRIPQMTKVVKSIRKGK